MDVTLSSKDNCVNMLVMNNVTQHDASEISSWLNACGMSDRQSEDICKQVIENGGYSFCNVEHRIEVMIVSGEIN